MLHVYGGKEIQFRNTLSIDATILHILNANLLFVICIIFNSISLYDGILILRKLLLTVDLLVFIHLGADSI